MSQQNTAPSTAEMRTEEAIALVLRAEQAAHQDISQVRRQADAMVEVARADGRRVTQRTEARIRSVVNAFERERAARLSELETQARAMATAPGLEPAELAALDDAVRRLAARLTGGP